jgi:arginine-tRNA-protein transferase
MFASKYNPTYNRRTMESRLRFFAPSARCEYLPDETARLEYLHVEEMEAAEYHRWLEGGWRRFGHLIFRPACPACRRCQSLRVSVDSFRPRRTQGRVWRANDGGAVRISIGDPSPTSAKRRMYERFHRFQQASKGWPPPDADGIDTFASNPFPTEEWCYFADDRLVAVGYVDSLPDGLSAIYFFYDPDERHRSLGTFNVLSIIDAARRRGLPWVYLGYYVEGCRSVEYKARFRPNEVLRADGSWGTFLR